MPEPTAELVRRELNRGEYLGAADLGTEAIGEDSTGADVELVWLTGLALARCGATDRAETLITDARLIERSGSSSIDLQADAAALRARLSKDRALAQHGRLGRELSLLSAEQYAQVGDRFDSPYATVNAATMFLLAGDKVRSTKLARRTLDMFRDASATAARDYWDLASSAEAHMVLGDERAARRDLRKAAAADPDWSMRATTNRQLSLVAAANGLDAAIVRELQNPSVVHYTGHMFSSGPEKALRRSVSQVLEARNVGAVYGSLACGSDIVVAEVALAAGLEVHIFLPCPEPAFLEQSVVSGGPAWLPRWHRVKEQATSFNPEPTQALADDAMFAYCDQLAMGTALLRARRLGTEAFQLALWNGEQGREIAGTAAAVRRWRELSGQTTVIDLDRGDFEPVKASTGAALEDGRPRHVRAMLFADVRGFSALAEPKLPEFFEDVMGGLARVIDGFGESVRYRNTWGDALYIVFSDPVTAANCALDIQSRLNTLARELGWHGLSARIGGHAGPVYDGYDPVRDEPTHYGTHVTRAARIEPRTPPGEVYITASFAALLALDGENTLRAEYVGHVPTAKDYGSFPMYLLRR